MPCAVSIPVPISNINESRRFFSQASWLNVLFRRAEFSFHTADWSGGRPVSATHVSTCLSGLSFRKMRVEYLCVDGVTLGCLGPLDAARLIVVVGRSNYKKSSASVERLLADLHLLGYSVCWFETRTIQTCKFLEDRFSMLMNGAVSRCCERLNTPGKFLRRLIKTVMLFGHPARWDFFWRRGENTNHHLAAELSTFLQGLKSPRVFLLAHSAGGIVSSLAEAAPLEKIACFGYPFKHPEKEEEPIRTAHLAGMAKPFLILQGDQDEYATAVTAKRYSLSPSIRLVSVDSDHNYDELSAVEHQRCLGLLHAFFA